MVPKIPKNPGNKVHVILERKFMETIATPSGVIFYQNTTFRPGHHATVTGIVQAVHSKRCGKKLEGGFDSKLLPGDLKPGDEIAFSYLGVFSTTYTDDNFDVFYESDAPHPQVQTWINKNGLLMVRTYLFNGNYEMRVVNTKDGEVITKEQGKYEVVEKVMGAYTFEETTEIHYDNFLLYGGKDYLKVLDELIYARKNDDGSIDMLGDHVLLELPASMKEETRDSGLILLSDFTDKSSDEIHLKVLHIGENDLGVSIGDTVVADKTKVQVYTFWGAEYALLKHEQLIALV